MESQEDYLDRICGVSKPKKIRKRKAKEDPNQIIFGHKWSDIQAMQQGTYTPKKVN